MDRGALESAAVAGKVSALGAGLYRMGIEGSKLRILPDARRIQAKR